LVEAIIRGREMNCGMGYPNGLDSHVGTASLGGSSGSGNICGSVDELVALCAVLRVGQRVLTFIG
jgi:hypothetical protein